MSYLFNTEIHPQFERDSAEKYGKPFQHAEEVKMLSIKLKKPKHEGNRRLKELEILKAKV